MRIDTAPIHEPISANSNVNRVWEQWFADISDSLEGNWIFVKKDLTASDTQVFTGYFNVRSGVIDVELEISGSVSFSSVTVELPYEIKDTFLSCYYYDSTYKNEPARVENNLILIPDLTGSKVVIKGAVMIDNSWLTKGA